MRFWDSSALVPLVVEQPTSSRAERWMAEDADAVTWTLTPVEVVSALRRLVRDGLLAERAATQAERISDELLARSHVITAAEDVKGIARRLLRVHALRAADALQLGAALAWAEGRPAGRFLHTLDARLAIAAEREGFLVPAED